MASTTRDNTSITRPIPATAGTTRSGTILAIVLTGQFMALLDTAIVNVAIPAIHTSLGASGASLQLVVAGYTIAYAVLLVTGARLGDQLGYRRMFLAGLTVFTLASFGCGVAGSASILIGLRFVQGVGAAVMIPQVLSLIQRTFTGAARARAMTIYSAVLAGGAVVGQVAGGLLISADLFGSGWRPVFLVNVPIGAALVLLGARLLPAGRGDQARGLDLHGLLTLSPAVFALVLPLVLGQSEHWPGWGWALMAGSAVLFAAFVLVERWVTARGGSPIVPGRVLRLRGFVSALAAVFLTMSVFGGFFFSFAVHLQGGLGDSALRAGLTFAPAAGAFALVSLNWRRLPEYLHEVLIVAGFVASAGSLAALAVVVHDGSRGGITIYVVAAVFGAGMAAAYSPLLTRMLLVVPVSDAPDATGVVITVVQLALVVGVATYGTLYLNLAGALPLHAAGAFRLLSAHALAATCVTLACGALTGGALAGLRAVRARD